VWNRARGHSPRPAERVLRGGIGATAGIVLAVLAALAIPISTPAPARADVLLAGAATRGFFDWEAMGGYERDLPLRAKVSGLTFPVRFEGHFATREGVTNMAFSSYLLATYQIPGFANVDFAPFVATGPALHLQGAWTNLGEFGDVLVEGESTLKWQFLVGSRLIAGEHADLYTEARYTVPSEFDFDYIAVGIRFHGPPAPPPAPSSPPPGTGAEP
jgi:hypothetical protein